MKAPKGVKNILIVLIIWSLIATFLLNEILKDDGLFAQIAIPFFFGIIHLVITIIAISQIYFTHKLTIERNWKVIYGILIALPLVLAFWKIPLLNTLF